MKILLALIATSVLLIVLFFRNSKKNQTHITVKERVRYRNDLISVKPYFCFDHFPKDIPENALGMDNFAVYNDKEKGMSWQVSFVLPDSSINDLNEEFKAKAIYKTEPQKDNLIINFRFAANKSNTAIHERTSNDEDDKYPIPHFYLGNHSDLNGRLSEDFNIYVIDAKPVNLMETSWQKDYTNGLAASEKWKYGYSYGVAISINENCIIYWGEIW